MTTKWSYKTSNGERRPPPTVGDIVYGTSSDFKDKPVIVELRIEADGPDGSPRCTILEINYHNPTDGTVCTECRTFPPVVDAFNDPIDVPPCHPRRRDHLDIWDTSESSKPSKPSKPSEPSKPLE